MTFEKSQSPNRFRLATVGRDLDALYNAICELSSAEMEVLDPLLDDHCETLPRKGLADKIEAGIPFVLCFNAGDLAAVVLAEPDPGCLAVTADGIRDLRQVHKVYAFVRPCFRGQHGIAHQWGDAICLLEQIAPALILAVGCGEELWQVQARVLARVLAASPTDEARLHRLLVEAKSGRVFINQRLGRLLETGASDRLVRLMTAEDYGGLSGARLLTWPQDERRWSDFYSVAAPSSGAVVRLLETWPGDGAQWRCVGVDSRWAEPLFSLQ